MTALPLRFSNVYGAGSARKSRVVARFIRDAIVSGPMNVVNPGDQCRDFIYADSRAHGTLAAVHRDPEL